MKSDWFRGDSDTVAKVQTQAGKDVEANGLGRRKGVWALSARGPKATP